jgi:hypothetical protein
MWLGVVEGFYGRPYDWLERQELVKFLGAEGYDHYLYAPKADAHLRSRWSEAHPEEQRERLVELAACCHESGLAFGLGLSPPSAIDDPGALAPDLLFHRVEQLLTLSIDNLALLFDDVRGHERSAERQCNMVNGVRRRFPELRLFMCPTYYSTSSVLDRIFGERPSDYLAQLGRELDASVEVFWTGPDICSHEYPEAHLEQVTKELGRKPWLWDNYPVNDGPKMCRFLHLRGFPPRTRSLADQIAGISVNPMNQAWLSRLPLASLPAALKSDVALDAERAFADSCARLLPVQFRELLREDLARFCDSGLDGMSAKEIESAIARYEHLDHPASRELVAWLRGETRVRDFSG